MIQGRLIQGRCYSGVFVPVPGLCACLCLCPCLCPCPCPRSRQAASGGGRAGRQPQELAPLDRHLRNDTQPWPMVQARPPRTPVTLAPRRARAASQCDIAVALGTAM